MESQNPANPNCYCSTVRNKEEECPPNKGIPAHRWTRMAFCDRVFRPPQKKAKEYFYFEQFKEPLSQLTLNVGDVHLQWNDGYWVNLGSDYQVAQIVLNEKEEEEMIEENKDLNTRIEILLDMNTNYEIKKAHLREKLAKLENQIRHFPGLDLEGEVYDNFYFQKIV